MSYKLVIFDLDGTLVDSLETIAIVINRALAEMGMQAYSTDLYRTLIGNGVEGMAEKVLPADTSLAQKQQAMQIIRNSYQQGWNDQLHLYPQIVELLDALQAKSLPLAINTNKDQIFADLTVAAHLSRWSFSHVIGAVDGQPRKPQPNALLRIIRAHQVQPEETLYLGDMQVDMETARNAGVCGVFCAWGFGDADQLTTQADLILQQPLDLLQCWELA